VLKNGDYVILYCPVMLASANFIYTLYRSAIPVSERTGLYNVAATDR
jgi:hypothetical protein